jgi:hypothetical protein
MPRKAFELLVFCLLLAGIATAADYPSYRPFGTTSVPLDSWVYPAFDRLAALGYAPTAIAGLRPWTRLECARLIEEAEDPDSPAGPATGEASQILSSLHDEFAPEIGMLEGESNRQLKLDSVYMRSMTIGGKPIEDSYHLGQTIINDFGRPYGQGENLISGLSGEASGGPFSVYFRGEYQHAPEPPTESLALRQYFSQLDLTTVPAAPRTDPTNRFELLDTYVGMNFKNIEFSFGKESLWWSPDEGGSVVLSDNAEPIYMFRVSRVTPFKLPWVLSRLGPMRVEAFIGKLEGHHFPPRPFLHGEKFSFKPTKNLEFGLDRTTVFAGLGHPMTFNTLFKTYFSAGNAGIGSNKGDANSGWDFSYRMPALRKWLTLYAGGWASDDVLPLAAPVRSAWNPGFYVPQIPGIPKLDLRGEAVFTELAAAQPRGEAVRFNYWNINYHDSYTNNGDLLSTWVGRDGKGWQAWSTYHFSTHNTLQAGYRNAEVDPRFLPGGATLNDVSGRAKWQLRVDVDVTGWLQYERLNYPVLSPNLQHNVTAAFELEFVPKKIMLH